MITIDRKKEIISQLKDEIDSSKSIFLADFKRLKVEEINEFREMCRDEGVIYRVVKNTYLKRAFGESDVVGLDDVLVGPSAIAMAMDDPVAPARVIKEFIKKYKNKKDDFYLKIGYMDNSTFDKNKIMQLADLPSREVLLGMLAGTLKAPIGKLAAVLQANISKVVYVLSAVKDKK